MPTDKSWADTDYKPYEKYKERFANAADFEFYFVDDAINYFNSFITSQ
jgi:zinc protease